MLNFIAIRKDIDALLDTRQDKSWIQPLSWTIFCTCLWPLSGAMTFMDDPIYEIQEIRAMWRQILAGGKLKDDKIDKVLIA